MTSARPLSNFGVSGCWEISANDPDERGYSIKRMYIYGTEHTAMKQAVTWLCRLREQSPGQIWRRLNDEEDDECCSDIELEDAAVTKIAYSSEGGYILDQILCSQGDPADDSLGSEYVVFLKLVDA